MIRLLLILLLCSFCQAQTEQEFFDALWMTESNKQLDPKDGDNGKSIGPYQIQETYFLDAKNFDASIDFKYKDCRKKDKAEIVIRAYMKRYAPKALESDDYETLARVHNGGPKGHKKKSTLRYWQKVSKELYKEKEWQSTEKDLTRNKTKSS